LAKSKTAFVFAMWQQQFAIACFGWEINPNSFLPLRCQKPPSNAVFHWTCQPTSNPFKCLSREHKCDIQTDDRQTDNRQTICVALGRIRFTASSHST